VLRRLLAPLGAVIAVGLVLVAYHEWTVLSHCTGSAGCTREGLCARGLAWRGGLTFETECQAGGDRNCRASWACFDHGRCEESDGACVATSDADCRGSRAACGFFGRCRAIGGKCVAMEDSDCRASMCCRDLGRCSPVGDDCAVRDAADCEGARACVRDGQSAANDADCTTR
jgi:hypothetical protein